MNAPRDSNFIPVLMGVSTADGKTPLPLMIDPVSGRVLVTIVGVASETPVVATQPFKRDDNHVPIKGGVSISDGKTVIPFHVSAQTGALSVNLING